MADACTTRSMMRREIEVTSVSGLVEAIEKLQHSAPHPTTFRGQRDDSPLLPVLTRKGGPAEDLPLERVLAVERKLVDEYRRRLSGVLGRSPTSWETVVIGRHNGLATRLLDWSESPAVALYFATAGEAAVDENKKPLPSFVIGTHGERKFLREIDGRASPRAPWKEPWAAVALPGPVFFLPDHVTERVFPQRSVFCFWGDPTTPFDAVMSEVWWFKVPAENRTKIQRQLEGLGITAEGLFRGLEGAATYLNWKIRDEERSTPKRNAPRRV
jgi:FRG domain-containing protein